MEKSNLAFITALYNTKDADFYTDIYFPVVKYAAMELYYASSDHTLYYDVIALQETIIKKTGITIPLLVLKSCIRSFSKQTQNDVRLLLYQNGDYFKIEQAWDASVNDDIENKADTVASQFRELEILFQYYLEVEKLDCDRTFLDFFSEYAEEAYAFIYQKQQADVIDEEYVNLVRFVEYVKKNKTDLYQIICDLMWSSIISGFLQRPQREDGTKYVERIEYYLDTTLVLNVLGLNSDESVAYSRDLLRIILESGGIPKIHPITVQEISQIFTQIEFFQSPKLGPSIQIAWERDGMTPSKILHLRNNLLNILNNEHGVTSLTLSQDELDRAIAKYKNNPNVKALAEKWKASSEDNFREIHDVYLHDYVSKLNQGSELVEKKKAYFVTLNNDVLDLYKEEQQSASVIHAGKVVMSLWIHGSRSEVVKKSVLVEVMSRCFAMNQTDARHKINTFNRHYKDNDLTKEDMQSMYTTLIRRSAKTINKFEEIEANEVSDDYNEDVSTQFTKAIVVLVREENNASKQSAMEQKDQIEHLNAAIDDLRKQLSASEKKDEVQAIHISEYRQTIEEKNEQIKQLKQEIETQKAITEINRQITQIKEDIKRLEEDKDSSLNNRKFCLGVIIEVVILLALVVCVVFWILKKTLINGFSIGAIFALFTLLLRFKDSYIIDGKVKKYQLRKVQIEVWGNNHPEYAKSKKQLEDLEAKKLELGGYLTK